MSNNAHIYRYVNYKEDGSVISITGIPEINYKNFEINLDLIPNFMLGKKKCKNYSINYFIGIAEGLITDDDEYEAIIKNNYVLYNVPIEHNDNFDFLIEHDSKNKKWIISSCIPDYKIKLVNYIPFYITLKNKYNFLISSHIIDVKNLNKKNYIKFNSNLEKNIDNLSLLTIKIFKKYSVKIL